MKFFKKNKKKSKKPIAALRKLIIIKRIFKREKMSSKTLTRAEIVENIHLKYGVGRDIISKILVDILDYTTKTLEEGRSLKVASFGTFEVNEKKQRVGRNPRTGEEAIITPRRVLNFRASKILKIRVNQAPKNKVLY
jgi:integration host factor subunit alpha